MTVSNEATLGIHHVPAAGVVEGQSLPAAWDSGGNQPIIHERKRQCHSKYDSGCSVCWTLVTEEAKAKRIPGEKGLRDCSSLLATKYSGVGTSDSLPRVFTCAAHLQPTTGAGSLSDCESDKLRARIAVLEESNLRTVELLRALSETCVVERGQAKTKHADLKAERAGFHMERVLLQSERVELDMNLESLRRERAAFEQGLGRRSRLDGGNYGSRARTIESNRALLLARGAALGASAANQRVTLANERERKALQADSERINVDMIGVSLRMQLASSEKAVGAASAAPPASTPSCTAANHLTGRAQEVEQREDLPAATLGSLTTYAHRATDDDDREPPINLDMTRDPLRRPPATNHATALPAFRRDFQEEEEDRECDIGAPPRKRQKTSGCNDLLPPLPETIPSPLGRPQLFPMITADPTKGMVLCRRKPRAPPPPPPPHDVPSARQPRNRAPPTFGVRLPAALLHDRQHEFALSCLSCRRLSFDRHCPVCTPSAPEASNRPVTPLSALLVLAQERTGGTRTIGLYSDVRGPVLFLDDFLNVFFLG
ncbi:hypothetical protein B0H17DRAFT_1137350 [Mycena rosella]|uniref:Uncharacterized protein n=1 Tax=Mycena rosella TaxID=1033263 RepID=A0AAD7DAB2_MYCRO|nr:hypothetical protein B0H17DRAFT_1137350 [Mycena rosella]